jgi:hypothetical protein
VVTNNHPLVSNDVSNDPRFYSDIDESLGFTTRSILCVPLVAQGTPIGAIEVINKRNGDFTQKDLELLTSMASFLSVALQNAQLYEDAAQRAYHNNLISDILSAINARLGFWEMGNTLVTKLRTIFRVDRASVTILDDTGLYFDVDILTERTTRSYDQRIRIPVVGTGPGWVAEHRKGRIVNDLRKERLQEALDITNEGLRSTSEKSACKRLWTSQTRGCAPP